MRKLRTVREEPKFNDQMEDLGVSHQRLDVVMDSVYFGLSRDPDSFPLIPGTQIRVMKTAVYPRAPSLRIFFTSTADEVHLLSVEFCQEAEPFLKYEED